MRAHATQITVTAPFFALSNHVRQRALGVEYYTLLAGPAAPRGPAEPAGSDVPAGRDGRAALQTDLF